jgi:hypothetical protein
MCERPVNPIRDTKEHEGPPASLAVILRVGFRFEAYPSGYSPDPVGLAGPRSQAMASRKAANSSAWVEMASFR